MVPLGLAQTDVAKAIGGLWGFTKYIDDFQTIAVVSASTIMCDTQWVVDYGGGSVGSLGFFSPSNAQHPGECTFRTGAVSGDSVTICKGTGITNHVYSAPDVTSFCWVVAVDVVTNVVAEVGLSDILGTDANAVVFYASAAGSAVNWHCSCSRLGVSTGSDIDSGVAFTAGVRYKLEAINTTGSQWEFFINDVHVARITTNLPTAVLNAGAFIKTTNAANKTLIADYTHLLMGNLAR